VRWGRELQGLSAAAAVFPQSPLRLAKDTLSRLPLAVLFPPQVQNYSVIRWWLILVGAMASAIQRFRGFSQRVGHQLGGSNAPPRPSAVFAEMPMAKRAEAVPGRMAWVASALTTGRMCSQVPVATPRLAHHRISNQCRSESEWEHRLRSSSALSF